MNETEAVALVTAQRALQVTAGPSPRDLRSATVSAVLAHTLLDERVPAETRARIGQGVAELLAVGLADLMDEHRHLAWVREAVARDPLVDEAVREVTPLADGTGSAIVEHEPGDVHAMTLQIDSPDGGTAQAWLTADEALRLADHLHVLAERSQTSGKGVAQWWTRG